MEKAHTIVQNMWSGLAGKKTKLGLTAYALNEFLLLTQQIDKQTYDLIEKILVIWIGYGMYDAVTRQKGGE